MDKRSKTSPQKWSYTAGKQSNAPTFRKKSMPRSAIPIPKYVPETASSTSSGRNVPTPKTKSLEVAKRYFMASKQLLETSKRKETSPVKILDHLPVNSQNELNANAESRKSLGFEVSKTDWINDGIDAEALATIPATDVVVFPVATPKTGAKPSRSSSKAKSPGRKKKPGLKVPPAPKQFRDPPRSSNVSIGPTIEDDRTAGKRQRKKYTPPKRSSYEDPKPVFIESKRPIKQPSEHSSDSDVPEISPSRNMKKTVHETKQGNKRVEPNNTQKQTYNEVFQGQALPRTPPQPPLPAEFTLSYKRGQTPSTVDNYANTDPIPKRTFQDQGQNPENGDSPLGPDGEATADPSRQDKFVHADLISQATTCYPCSCCAKKCGTACRSDVQCVKFCPCACQACRVYHYCFDILNRHSLAANDAYLGISAYENSAARQMHQQQQQLADSKRGSGNPANGENDWESTYKSTYKDHSQTIQGSRYPDYDGGRRDSGEGRRRPSGSKVDN